MQRMGKTKAIANQNHTLMRYIFKFIFRTNYLFNKPVSGDSSPEISNHTDDWEQNFTKANHAQYMPNAFSDL